MSKDLRSAVFFDKDGTLIEDVPYNVDPARLRLMPGAIAGLQELKAAGFRLIVITNQSGLARRLFTEAALATIYSNIDRMLAEKDLSLDGFYHCPHLPPSELQGVDACLCRKPEPGLIHEASADHSIDLRTSWLIGDIADDIEAGRRAGCRTVLVTADPEGSSERHAGPDFLARDLAEAAKVIIGQQTDQSVPVGNMAGVRS